MSIQSASIEVIVSKDLAEARGLQLYLRHNTDNQRANALNPVHSAICVPVLHQPRLRPSSHPSILLDDPPPADPRMLRRQSVTVIRHTTSHLSPRPRYFRHQPLSVRSAVRPTSRASHHPTNLPQIFPRSPSTSRRNSTLSTNNKTGFPSKRMRFVRRFVETVCS